MKESPLQKAIKEVYKYSRTTGEYADVQLVCDVRDVERILEQMELDMLEEFKQGIDNAFKE